MKILHISPGGLEVGGVQSVIMDIVKKLLRITMTSYCLQMKKDFMKKNS